MKKAKRLAIGLLLVATISFTVLTPVTTLAEPPGPQSGSTSPAPPPPPPPPRNPLIELILVLLGIV
jgi:hypothetical protein